jgi:hypothetical protein
MIEFGTVEADLAMICGDLPRFPRSLNLTQLGQMREEAYPYDAQYDSRFSLSVGEGVGARTRDKTPWIAQTMDSLRGKAGI